MNKYISIFILAPAIYVGFDSSSQAQGIIPGGTANPRAVQPFESNVTDGNGSAAESLLNGGSVSASIPVFSPVSHAFVELIYGFEIVGPSSSISIDISGQATTEGVVGSATVDAKAVFGTLTDIGGVAGLAGPHVMADNSSVGSNERIDSFDSTYSVMTDKSYAIELSVQLDSLGSPGMAFVDPQLHLDVSDPQDYNIVLSPGISLGSSASVPDSGTTLGLLALSLAALAAVAPFHRRFATGGLRA